MAYWNTIFLVLTFFRFDWSLGGITEKNAVFRSQSFPVTMGPLIWIKTSVRDLGILSNFRILVGGTKLCKKNVNFPFKETKKRDRKMTKNINLSKYWHQGKRDNLPTPRPPLPPLVPIKFLVPSPCLHSMPHYKTDYCIFLLFRLWKQNNRKLFSYA